MCADTGIITGSSGGIYTVVTDSGTVLCPAKGVFRHLGITPLVGDSCQLKNGAVSAICARKNALIRPPVANLDLIFITVAADDPAPDTLLTDKLTAIAVKNRIKPVIIVSKSDLSPQSADNLKDIYTKSGFDVLVTCRGSAESITTVRNFIALSGAGISAFAGVSGAGKSTLLNAVFPSLGLQTGEISQRTGHGRHTTRAVTLFPLSDFGLSGYIADTPGFSMIDFVEFDFMTREELPDAFPDFVPLYPDCRWRGCTHTKEDGCAVMAAVESGRLSKTRLESYLALRNDLKDKTVW